jgi:hypothetical protein
MRFRLVLLCVLVGTLLTPGVARADIKVQAWVRLITGGQCKVKRPIDSNGYSQVVYETLDCNVYPEHSNNSYYFETQLENNVVEQIIDAAQFSKAIYDFASDVAAAVGSAGTASMLAGAKAANDVKTAYEEFNQLMDGWGGKSKDTQNDFVVSNPNSDYRWIEITLSADSDGDPFEKAVLAPASALPGMTIQRINNSSHAKFYQIKIDLTLLPPLRRIVIPVGLAVGEGDCSFSCLKISKVVNLIVERPEDGDVMADTHIAFSKGDPSCDVCGFARRDVLLHNLANPGKVLRDEKIQQTTVSIRQGANGDYSLWNKGKREKYDSVAIGLDVDSPRLRKDGYRIDLSADCLGPCPPGIVRHIYPVSSYFRADRNETEGRGSAYFNFDPRALPFGTTTLVFNASYEAGHGGTIAQHVVKIVKDATITAKPAVRNIPMAARAADGGALPVRGVPVPPSVVAVPFAPPNISGRWTSNTGLIYEITQQGNQFKWTVVTLGQTATGTIQGIATTVAWSDRSGSGLAKGTIKVRDASGRPIRIEWNNGVIFTR